MKKILLLMPILLLLASCLREEKNEAFRNGLLWRIESKNGKESYIFGTVHLYPGNQLELSKNVVAKLKNCSTLALEHDVTNTSEQRKFMDFEMPDFFIKTYRILLLEYGKNMVSMENQLIQAAREHGLRISGLESTDEILGIMKRLNEIEIPESEFQKDRMLQVYGQTLEMYKKEEIGIFKDSLLTQIQTLTALTVNQRNRNWLEDVVFLIESEPTFIAVGMGHLGGQDGILSLLSNKGYQLTRVEINTTLSNTIDN